MRSNILFSWSSQAIVLGWYMGVLRRLTRRAGADHHGAMIILPGLTSTKKERIPAFLADMRRRGVKSIALFPTCLTRSERQALYAELEDVPGLGIPHVV